MEEKTKSVEVKCPTCGRNEKISVPESLCSRKKMGLIKVEVPSGAVCPDHFLIFLDPKGIVRGYEKIEIGISTLIEDSIEESEKKIFRSKLISVTELEL